MVFSGAHVSAEEVEYRFHTLHSAHQPELHTKPVPLLR